MLSLRSFRVLLTPLTYIPAGEAHHFATDALRYAQHILQNFYALIILFPCNSVAITSLLPVTPTIRYHLLHATANNRNDLCRT
jgi:hypothetical protein